MKLSSPGHLPANDDDFVINMFNHYATSSGMTIKEARLTMDYGPLPKIFASVVPGAEGGRVPARAIRTDGAALDIFRIKGAEVRLNYPAVIITALGFINAYTVCGSA